MSELECRHGKRIAPPPRSPSHVGLAVAVNNSDTNQTQGTHEAAKVPVALDIEHIKVEDDPRKWPSWKKNVAFSIVTAAAMCNALSSNIYFPAINEVKADLGASDAELALSVSLFILPQGFIPLFWSAFSEVKGRKLTYALSNAVFLGGTIGCSRASSLPLFLVMRCVQAAGSSAVISLGAGTLADMFEPAERGARLGLFNTSPLLGPSIGSLFGGVLTKAFNWRATFYFLIVYGALCSVGYVVLPETYRKERSLAWRAAYARSLEQHEQQQGSPGDPVAPVDSTGGHQPGLPPLAGNNQQEADRSKFADINPNVVVKVTWRDVNPFSATIDVLKVPQNVVAFTLGGILFAAQWSLSYTTSLDLKKVYSLSSLEIGLVLFGFGVGGAVGSFVGGKCSDVTLKRAKLRNNGSTVPEDRLYAAIPWAMVLVPAGVVTYAWVLHQRLAAVICVLVVIGISLIWEYSCLLAYVVDSNRGRATSAVAVNSAFRGLLAFISSEVALPVQKGIGNGGLYTLWAGLISLASILLVVVSLRPRFLRVGNRAQRPSDPA